MPKATKEKLAYISDWASKNPFHYMASQKKRQAKLKGIAFDLDAAYLKSIVPKNGLCPIRRVKMLRPREQMRGNIGAHDDLMSIDRLDPAKGYVRGNVSIISLKANRMKNDCTDAESFIRLARYIRKSLAA